MKILLPLGLVQQKINATKTGVYSNRCVSVYNIIDLLIKHLFLTN
jgi:hypothetical protein